MPSPFQSKRAADARAADELHAVAVEIEHDRRRQADLDAALEFGDLHARERVGAVVAVGGGVVVDDLDRAAHGGDRIAGLQPGEDRDVGVEAALDRVVAGAAGDAVIARGTAQHIGAAGAGDGVGAAAAGRTFSMAIKVSVSAPDWAWFDAAARLIVQAPVAAL